MEARLFHDNQHVNFEAFSISIQGHPSSFLTSRPKVILLHEAMQLNKLTIGTQEHFMTIHQLQDVASPSILTANLQHYSKVGVACQVFHL